MQLSEQLIGRASKFAETVTVSTLEETIPDLSTINSRGRRVMDQANLDHQMMEEDQKAGSLRCKILTLELAITMAGKTTLINDATYVYNAALVLWHDRVPKLLVRKFWDSPAENLEMANEVFVHLHIANDNGIKTKKVGLNLIKNDIDFVDEYGKKILEFLKNMGGFHDKAVHRSDVLSFFVHPVARAFGDDIVIEPVEEALVKSCSVLDPYYTCTAAKQNGSDDEYTHGNDLENESVSDPFDNE